jgi:hypothetical protein
MLVAGVGVEGWLWMRGQEGFGSEKEDVLEVCQLTPGWRDKRKTKKTNKTNNGKKKFL